MRHGSRTDRFLREIVEELDLLATVGYRPTAVLRYGMEGVRRMRALRARQDRRRAMERLRKLRLVAIERSADTYRIALTDSGAQAYWRTRLLAAELLPEGQTCFVIFDIPESQRRLRDELRRLLVESGFAALQKSVWISRFDVAEPLRTFLNVRKARHAWIRIFTATES